MKKASTCSEPKILVVCPASVISVWLQECAKFTPELKIVQLQGALDQRKAVASQGNLWNILILSYALVRNDTQYLRTINFHAIVLDEAQHIKNPDAAVTKAIKSLTAEHRIVLTGTPLENKLQDLWSITDFLNPGYLGSRDEFTRNFANSSVGASRLQQKISPLILRRLKAEVAKELPSRTVETMVIPLSNVQAQMYEKELMATKKAVKGKGVIDILAGLTRLRQICCHPLLLLRGRHSVEPSALDKSGDTALSSKLDCLIEKIVELRENNHSVLIFSQFTTMLSIIEEALHTHHFKTFKITGETPLPRRAESVKEFQESKDQAVFLLSLRAAATGLTLTKADYVFIYDPWWNPALERQAIDRTHRIGQKKPVIAYRLVAAGTVEEKISRLQKQKQLLFSEVIDGATGQPSQLNAEELMNLIS